MTSVAKNLSILALLLAILFGSLSFVAAQEENAETQTTENTEETPPSEAAKYQFQNEGIFGCNTIGGVNMSAGTQAAIGGVYVPVNDAAITLNTGIITYKECVLRPLQVRLRENAASALLKRNVESVETGRDGNKRYVVDPLEELRTISDKSEYSILTDGTLDALVPAFRKEIQKYAARAYQTRSRQPESILSCAFKDIEKSLENKSDDVIGAILAQTNPFGCNPVFTAAGFDNLAESRNAQSREYARMMWDWGRGFYPVTNNEADPLSDDVLTPASVVQESFQQILGSSVRQLESANDIGQMIGALFSGVTTQALSDTRGLAGFRQSIGGQPSYLDQVAKESSQGVVGAAVNAALSILNKSREVEGSYLASTNGIATKLTQTGTDLKNTEKACWALIEPKARAYAAKGECSTDTTTNPPLETCVPFQLSETKIRTSTSTLAFSQQVIDSQIKSLSEIAEENVKTAQKAVQLVEQLIASVTNTASLNAQRLALQQLDSLVAQKLLHTQYDAQRAGEQKKDVDEAMNTLKTDTAKAWGDSSDPNVGWCNVNNPDVIRQWAERWKK
ncbi:MAG: hypothetical protein HYS26_00550 [Candidatus Kaiserbacteria bacterium]|nr:MAG: hypothetical protein HYS26_00550 [Candidatus Kaiserbacteria bacterium]